MAAGVVASSRFCKSHQPDLLAEGPRQQQLLLQQRFCQRLQKARVMTAVVVRRAHRLQSQAANAGGQQQPRPALMLHRVTMMRLRRQTAKQRSAACLPAKLLQQQPSLQQRPPALLRAAAAMSQQLMRWLQQTVWHQERPVQGVRRQTGQSRGTQGASAG